MEVRTVDYHTAGEPFRIVVSDVGEIAGANVRERRETAAATERIDRVRRLLCHEPRGHADMYGCFVVPPDDDGADFGALFWHKDGYSTACGHGTIALGAWAVESGRVPAPPTEGRRGHRRTVGTRHRARALRGRHGEGGRVRQRARQRDRPRCRRRRGQSRRRLGRCVLRLCAGGGLRPARDARGSARADRRRAGGQGRPGRRAGLATPSTTTGSPVSTAPF